MVGLTVTDWCVVATYIAISNWFELSTCFLTFYYDPYFLSQIQFFIYIILVVIDILCTVATILYTIMRMNCINLVWLDPLPCKILLQSLWPYTKEGVAMQVWNYVLQCLPMLKTAVVICSFSCLITLEAKCHPSNGSNFVVCFMTCTHNI